MKRRIQNQPAGGRVIGLGVDIVDIPRFRRVLRRHGAAFINRIFLPSEQKYCLSKASPWIHYAGRFAAKEAVAKAFGTGIGKEIGWLDMEIISSENQAPAVVFSAALKRFAKERGVGNVMISISHTHAHTVAVALLTG